MKSNDCKLQGIMEFKFCRQRDSMSCGVACLQMICKNIMGMI